jgi:hypothetical protein
MVPLSAGGGYTMGRMAYRERPGQESRDIG